MAHDCDDPECDLDGLHADTAPAQTPSSNYEEMSKLDKMYRDGTITAARYVSRMIPLISVKYREEPAEADRAFAVCEDRDRRIEEALRPLADMILRRILERTPLSL
jgi:hypothetical protein